MLPCPSPIHTGIAQMQTPMNGRKGMHTLPAQQLPRAYRNQERGSKAPESTNMYIKTQSALATISFTPCSLATGCSG